MPISSVTRKVGPFSGTGTVSEFSFDFKVFQASDLYVVKADSDGVETVLVLNSDYTVSLNSNQDSNPGGSITLASALASGYTMIISSTVGNLQPTDLTNQGGFYPSVITDALDRATIQIQQLQEQVDRSAKLPITNETDAEQLVADIVLLANNKAELDVLYDNINDIRTVASDLNEPVSEINTVAGSIANVDAVGGNISNVNTVAGNTTNINTVSGISGNVTTVAGISGSVTTVAGISGNVTTVAGISTNVTAVAGNATNINTVAGDKANIDIVAADKTNIDAVAANKTNIDTVAGNNTNVTTVAGKSTEITAVAGQITPTNNIGTVAGNTTNINTVAGISGNVTTVAGISGNVTTVAGNNANVTTVAGKTTEITTVAGQITPTNNVGTVAGIASSVSTVAGISANVTAVAGNATNINAVAGNATHINTVAGISSDVTAVAAIDDAVSTAADNVTAINDYSKVWLGGKASDPTLRNDGSALVTGDQYFNTGTNKVRVYSTGTGVWVDSGITFSPTVERFSGTGSQTAFTLATAPGTAMALIVNISGVVQTPTVDYTVSGTTLTFTTAPPSGTNNITVQNFGSAGVINIPADASVATASIQDSAVTTAKIATNAVTVAKLQNSGYELGMRNRIINGGMTIDQRNAGASVTPATTGYSIQYLTDRFYLQTTQASKITMQQNAGSVTPPAGYTNYLGATVAAAYSVSGSDTFNITQAVEGLNIADLGWGTASAQTITVSFWVRSSLTGIFGGSIYNYSGARSYPFSYTINAANTWEYKTVVVPGDTTGTWLTTNGIGISLSFSLGAGSGITAAAGSWGGPWKTGANGQVNLVGTNGATFYITGVQLEKGSVATPFEFRPYGTELQLCQRYLPAWNGSGTVGPVYDNSTVVAYLNYKLPTTARTAPTGITTSAMSTFNYYKTTNVTPTSVSFQNGNQDTCLVQIGLPSATGTAGQAAIFTGTNAQILFTGCEL